MGVAKALLWTIHRPFVRERARVRKGRVARQEFTHLSLDPPEEYLAGKLLLATIGPMRFKLCLQPGLLPLRARSRRHTTEAYPPDSAMTRFYNSCLVVVSCFSYTATPALEHAGAENQQHSGRVCRTNINRERIFSTRRDCRRRIGGMTKHDIHTEDDDETPVATERSVIAKEIESLQSTILRFANERERLPQPLFWSLFNSRIKEIKAKKQVERLCKEAFGELES